MSYKILRLHEVIEQIGLSRSTIYLRMSKGEFPKSITLGERAVGWNSEDINQWVDERIAASKAASHES